MTEAESRPADRSDRVIRFGIFGHYGNDNLGDEAITAAMSYQLKSRYPNCELVGFSLNPDSTHRRHGISAFPIRRQYSFTGPSPTEVSGGAVAQVESSSFRDALKNVPVVRPVLKWLRDLMVSGMDFFREVSFLKTSYGRLKGVDLLIVAGSNQIEDSYGGSMGYPYTVWKWTLLARLAGIPVAFASVGASPMPRVMSRYFCCKALRRAVYRSYRDVGSLAVVESLGITSGNLVTTDIAFSLPYTKLPARDPNTKPVTVAINPMPYLDHRYWPSDEVSDDGYRNYVRTFSEFCVWLAKEGHTVLLFPTQLSTDILVIDDILKATRGMVDTGTAQRIQSRTVIGFEDIFGLLQQADLAVATRFHAVLFSQLALCPVLAVSYQRKIDDLMAAAGLGSYCQPIAKVTAGSLQDTFLKLMSSRAECRGDLEKHVARNQSLLNTQYDKLLHISK